MLQLNTYSQQNVLMFPYIKTDAYLFAYVQFIFSFYQENSYIYFVL